MFFLEIRYDTSLIMLGGLADKVYEEGNFKG